MNIVKQFEDFQFFCKHYEGSEPNDPAKDKWIWGLGADGDLYCLCSEAPYANIWRRYPQEFSRNSVSLDDMRRIVREFGHLVIFT